MTEVMMMLGEYQFSLDTAAYQSLRRRSEYRWPSQDRLGRLPARQFVGPGSESIDIDGAIYPHYRGGLGQMTRLRDIAGKGRPQRLVDGRGISWGLWCVESIEESQTVFLGNGDPRRIDFRMVLARYGEDS
jgi:phage protein U